MRVNGAVRADGYYPPNDGDNNRENSMISWVPSVGWEFSKDNYNTWRTITITAHKDFSETITFSHEVWATSTQCPVHDVGRVEVTGSGGDNGGDNGDKQRR